MTLKQALESGKSFKRAHFPGHAWRTVSMLDSLFFNVADVLAVDWEIQSEPRVLWVNPLVLTPQLSQANFSFNVQREGYVKFREVIE